MTKKKTTRFPPKYVVALAAIIAVVVLELFALASGIDGAVFASAMAGIGGIAGYALKARTG